MKNLLFVMCIAALSLTSMESSAEIFRRGQPIRNTWRLGAAATVGTARLGVATAVGTARVGAHATVGTIRVGRALVRGTVRAGVNTVRAGVNTVDYFQTHQPVRNRLRRAAYNLSCGNYGGCGTRYVVSSNCTNCATYSGCSSCSNPGPVDPINPGPISPGGGDDQASPSDQRIVEDTSDLAYQWRQAGGQVGRDNIPMIFENVSHPHLTDGGIYRLWHGELRMYKNGRWSRLSQTPAGVHPGPINSNTRITGLYHQKVGVKNVQELVSCRRGMFRCRHYYRTVSKKSVTNRSIIAFEDEAPSDEPNPGPISPKSVLVDELALR